MATAPKTAHGDFSATNGEARSLAVVAGAEALMALRAVKMKTATRAKKAPTARKAKSMLRRDSARVAGSVIRASAANTPPVSRIGAAIAGPSVVPRELKNCEKFRRACEWRGVPRAATSGLAATCRMVTPEAMMNRAISTPGYQSIRVAAGTIRQPMTMVTRAAMIERL